MSLASFPAHHVFAGEAALWSDATGLPPLPLHGMGILSSALCSQQVCTVFEHSFLSPFRAGGLGESHGRSTEKKRVWVTPVTLLALV